MMRPRDLLLFLFGDRGAIERIAAARHAWLVGAILVLSAGIARNYDHLDLLRDPEWVIGPFVASLVTTSFIFLWITVPLRLMKVGSYWRQQGVFLALVWMTAPCAWLYGIPVEAFTDIVTATKWNIVFLAIVSFWRVAIMVRAVSVLAEVSWKRVLPLLLAPAALEAMVGSWYQGLSLVGIMGGVRLSPQDALLKQASNFTSAASFWIFLICLVFTFVFKGRAKRPLLREKAAFCARPLGGAVFCLALWAVASLPLQPKVANRHRLQELIHKQDFPAAIAFAAEKGKSGFPEHHYLPPEPAWWFPLDLLDALSAGAPAWLREEWEGNAIESLKLNFHLDRKEWRDLVRNHPSVADAVRAHAERLRGRAAPLGGDDRSWLQSYDEIVGKEDDPGRLSAPSTPGEPPRR